MAQAQATTTTTEGNGKKREPKTMTDFDAIKRISTILGQLSSQAERKRVLAFCVDSVNAADKANAANESA